MVSIAISDFRAHIQVYLKKVSQGEEIVITSRGREMAKVLPLRNKSENARKKLKALAKTAIVKNITDPIPAEWKENRW